MRAKIPPKELRDLWAKIPSVKCQGKCANSCGPIGCSSLERRLIEGRAGKILRAEGEEKDCTMLKFGRCSVYSIRPVICRLWGAVPSMPCPHGCEPEFELSDADGYILMAEASRISGDPDGHAMEDLINSAPAGFWDALKEYAQGAPDLAGHSVTSRRASAERLVEVGKAVRISRGKTMRDLTQPPPDVVD
jgi:hypothetical protein